MSFFDLLAVAYLVALTALVVHVVRLVIDEVR